MTSRGHFHPPDTPCTCCGPQSLQAAEDDLPSDRNDEEGTATDTTKDLRRARQKARETLRNISDDVDDFLRQRDVERRVETDSGRQRVNEQLTRLIKQNLFQELLQWLDQRRKVVMGRGAQAAFDRMQTALTVAEVSRELVGSPNMTREDRQINRMLHDVDAGLLKKLSEDAAERITRQIRLGFRNRESVREVGRRVDMVLVDGDDPDRMKKGVQGQTVMSKGELIAHDSIQDAYLHSTRRRYLKNGFRYAIFDAVIDNKTSAVCTRMNEDVIDMVNSPHLVPPLHPWCRSDLRPTLNRDGVEPTTDEDISDSFLQTIYQTKSYRPPEPSETYYRPGPLTDMGPDAQSST